MKNNNLYLSDSILDQMVKNYAGVRDNITYSSFDFETTGLNPYKKSQAFSMAICYPDMSKEIIDFKCDSKGNYSRDKKGWKRVQNYFNDTSLGKVAHNLLFEKMFLKRHGIIIPKETIFHDSMLIHQMIRNNHPAHSLDYLAWEYGNWSRDLDKKVKAIGKRKGYQAVSKVLMHPYQLADVERCLVLFNVWHDILLSGSKEVYRDYLNEVMLLNTTEMMQFTGIGLSLEHAHELLNTLKKWLLQVQEQVKNKYGKYYNLGSASSLKYLLFDRLKLPVIEYTAKGNIKIDKNVLFKYKEKFIDNNSKDPEKYELLNLILKTRSYIKGIANIKTYINLAGENGILNPSIKTNHARTGRAASENPNGQNVQKEKNANVPFPIPARSIFFPPVGYTYYLVDYAGIEMRLIVDAVAEEEMLHILNYGHGDLHAPVASLFFGDIFDLEPDKSIKKSIRSKAKNVNFAIPYGVGIDKAFIMLAPYVTNMKETQSKLDLYAEKFPKVFSFSTKFENIVKKCGYITTAFGRVLYVNRKEAYMAGNYKIQGTAAALLKRASNRLHHYLNDIWCNDIRLVIPIHDELIIRVPNKLVRYESTFLHDMSEIMTQGYNEIKVKLDVEWKRTQNSWADAQGINYKKLIKRKVYIYS